MATLLERYKTEVRPALKAKLGAGNPMELPRLRKVVVNMGVGIADQDTLKAHVAEMAALTGQKPVVTKARQSISNFKLREGMSVGIKVTLRGQRMYEFLDRLISAGLPRIRDFRGVSASGFDGQGNFSMGLKDQTIFPEIDPDHVARTQGMNITVVMSAQDRDAARELLKLMGFPFAERAKGASEQ